MAYPLFLLVLLSSLLTGCASLFSSATQRMADNLANAMLTNDDPETVRAAAPAYLVLLDSLVAGDPEDVATLLAASSLYGSYATAFVDDPERARRLATRSLAYARSALCLDLPPVCKVIDQPQDLFEPVLDNVQPADQPVLYAFATAWAGWIQLNSDDWNAMAQIPKLSALFATSLRLDESYDHGGAHLYLGVLHSQLPPAAGGKPERGRAHFEKARQLSGGRNLMVNVMYAEHYARLVFDRELHDNLLRQVLETEQDASDFRLANAIARQRATTLLEQSEEFF